MLLRKIILSCFVLCCFVVLGYAQKQQLSKIDIIDLKRHLTFLSSDELQGRKIGAEPDGLGMAANYLIDNAKRIGLKPADESYIQKVELISTKPAENNFIEVINNNGKSVYHSNAMVLLQGIMDVKSLKNRDVVLAGFGDKVSNEVTGGKVLVIGQGNSETFRKGDDIRFNFGEEMKKVEVLAKEKPEVILFVTTPQDTDNKGFNRIKSWFVRERFSVEKGNANTEVPVLFVTPVFADKLLGGKGKYKKYLAKTAKKNSSGWQEVSGRKVNLQAKINSKVFGAKNIIGIVEGSDPVLKNEYLLFLAHYDHLGVSQNGDVYNGADDNGSGTVAIMEVAEAFTSLAVKPKRSIVFLWVTCEEIGHIGSAYYCENPIYPLENTVAAINLDMVGRVYESPRDDVFKDSHKKVKDFDGLYTLSNDVWPRLAEINNNKCRELGLIPDTSLPKQRFLRASDHYQFHKKGVPILNYSTGYHADFHKVGDKVEKINFEKIKRVADLCFLLGYEVANLEKIDY